MDKCEDEVDALLGRGEIDFLSDYSYGSEDSEYDSGDDADSDSGDDSDSI